MLPSSATTFPEWVPGPVQLYLRHTEKGESFRAIARDVGVNASTVLRQVRRYERRRDDPLMDDALSALARERERNLADEEGKREGGREEGRLLPDPAQLEREGMRLLRRLAEPRAVLVFARDMEDAAIMREGAKENTRTAVVGRAMARAFVLQDWVACRRTGRVSTYEITTGGKTALRHMMKKRARRSMRDPAAGFAEQHQVWGSRTIVEDGRAIPHRVNLAESPVAVLGRRRDKQGKPFLAPDLVEAAERLREDFELAQMGPRIAQNWENFLTGGNRGNFSATGAHEGGGAARARERVMVALRDLGPGLGDVVLRVCCFLEGIEATERRMGWAARSGKIVLRIALMRLRRHYDATYGRHGPLIG